MSKLIGYAKHTGSSSATITDWHGKKIGEGRIVNCTRVKPNSRGHWISSEKCSYRFEVDGRWYSGRGYGDGMRVSLRPMKSAPRRR
jgi:hypothetical protein